MNLTAAVESFTIAGAPFWSFWTIFWLAVIVLATVALVWLAIKIDEEFLFVAAMCVCLLGGLIWGIAASKASDGATQTQKILEIDKLGYNNVELSSGGTMTASDEDGNYVRAEVMQDGDTYFILKY